MICSKARLECFKELISVQESNQLFSDLWKNLFRKLGSTGKESVKTEQLIIDQI